MVSIPQQLIETLALEPLPDEGGLFVSTYQAPHKVDGRPMGSAIYFMLWNQGYSHLHRLPVDEVYHYYKGDKVELLELLPDGTHQITILGSDICAGEQVQHVVKAGHWQGSHLMAGSEYALMGTTMSPAFIPEEYEHGDRIALQQAYPGCKALIETLTGDTCHC